MKNVIKPEVLSLYNTIKKSGFEVYLVGGCVRDMLMERPVTDWDLTTNATPEQIQAIFPDSFYDNGFGTVGIPYDNKEAFEEGEKNYIEITTYRHEKDYKNLRHPETIEWGKNIVDDLARRDFTVNAIACEIKDDQDLVFIDPYEGQQDIEKKIIKAARDPEERFNEDALRLLRAVRFAAQLNFEIESKTWDSVVKNANHITKISFERIRDELLKMLVSNSPFEGISLLNKSGMLDLIIPELAQGKGISQERPGRHHKSDVFTHNIESLHHCPSKDPIVRLATLLHDVGKPQVIGKDEEGLVIFYNHEVKGAQIAKTICERLKLSKKQKEKVYTLIRWHMFTIDEHITDSAVRRFIRRVGVENVNDMIDLRIGDRLGGGTQVAESWRLKLFKERLTAQLNPPFSINDLAIDGNDIMRELNIPPGRKVGEILQKLFEEVDENLELNNKEYLIKRIHELNIN